MRPELAALKVRSLFASPETLLTSEHGFGLKTATNLQKALAYVVCGEKVPDRYFEDPEVSEAFGGVPPKERSPEAIICAAIRCAKTLEACVGVTWATQKVEMPPGIRPGEVPRVSIVSKYTDQAEAAFDYLKGAFTTSDPLKTLVLSMNSDSIVVRHPSGTPIEIMVVAGARSGTTLISRWMAGMIFDEAPRISSEADGVVNLEAMRTAIIGRMLPGSVVIYVGSPVGATGMIYNLVSENWQKHDQEITVVRAKGPSMNPYWWTTERCADLKRRDPDAYKTDVLAEFLDPETNLFTSVEVDRAMSIPEDGAPPEPGRVYTACMDPATRGNSWTFGIADTTDNKRFRNVFAHQWTGSQAEPLSPKAVLTEMVPTLRAYGLRHVLTDQWAVDALRDIVRDLSRELDYAFELTPITVNAVNKTKSFLGLKARFTHDAIELVKNLKVRDDLLNVKKRISGGGEIRILFNVTSDGRHADYAAMLAMLCGTYIQESKPEEQVIKGDDEFDDFIEPEERPLDQYSEADLW